MKTTKTEKLFAAALARVESASIRAWATTEHNRPVWLKITKGYLGKDDAELRLSIDVISSALGL